MPAPSHGARLPVTPVLQVRRTPTRVRPRDEAGFATGPRSLLCENGANTVVGEDGKLRSDVEAVFAHTDYMVSKTVTHIVEAMRRRRDQLTQERRTPDRIDLTPREANQWERDAVALWCSQRKRNPHNPDFRYLQSNAWVGASETVTGDRAPDAVQLVAGNTRSGRSRRTDGGTRTDRRGCYKPRIRRRRRARELRADHRCTERERQSACHPDRAGGLFALETKATRTEPPLAPVRVAGRRLGRHGEQRDGRTVQGHSWAIEGATSPTRKAEAVAREVDYP